MYEKKRKWSKLKKNRKTQEKYNEEKLTKAVKQKDEN